MAEFHVTRRGDGRCTPPVPEAQSEWASLQLGRTLFAKLHILYPDSHGGQRVTQSGEVLAWPLPPGLRGSKALLCVSSAPAALSEWSSCPSDCVSTWAVAAILVFFLVFKKIVLKYT